MAEPVRSYEHITFDDNGVPVVAGANTKVVEIVTLAQAHGLSPEELCYQLPHLSMGQVHAALAFYWDHKSDVDADMLRREERADAMRRELGQPDFIAKLRHGDPS